MVEVKKKKSEEEYIGDVNTPTDACTASKWYVLEEIDVLKL